MTNLQFFLVGKYLLAGYGLAATRFRRTSSSQMLLRSLAFVYNFACFIFTCVCQGVGLHLWGFLLISYSFLEHPWTMNAWSIFVRWTSVIANICGSFPRINIPTSLTYSCAGPVFFQGGARLDQHPNPESTTQHISTPAKFGVTETVAKKLCFWLAQTTKNSVSGHNSQGPGPVSQCKVCPKGAAWGAGVLACFVAAKIVGCGCVASAWRSMVGGGFV